MEECTQMEEERNDAIFCYKKDREREAKRKRGWESLPKERKRRRVQLRNNRTEAGLVKN